jgi:hypothetical protein
MTPLDRAVRDITRALEALGIAYASARDRERRLNAALLTSSNQQPLR